jgi:hypothetical protein
MEAPRSDGGAAMTARHDKSIETTGKGKGKPAPPDKTTTQKTIHQIASLHVTVSRYGYRGIQWYKAKHRFRAQIYQGQDRHRQYLGYFETAEQAALAYDIAARQEYGEHAALNFPNDGERHIVQSKLSHGLCPHGHNLQVFGYRAPDGMLNCRKCNAAAQARYKARRRARAASGESARR